MKKVIEAEPKAGKELAIQKAIEPEALISQAIDKSVSVETMEKLLGMRRELKAEFAKEKFDESMAEFQGECPTIKKTKQVKDRQGTLLYAYAPIESIVEQTKELIQKKGFSYLIKTIVTATGVKVECVVKHKFGHIESSEMEVPLGAGTQIMSAPQKTAAATTFAKRYAFCNAFGIMTGDDDTDAREVAPNGKAFVAPTKPGAVFMSLKQQIEMMDLPTLQNTKVKIQTPGEKAYTQADKIKLLKLVDERIATLQEIPIIQEES
jgi:hypothetical protein